MAETHLKGSISEDEHLLDGHKIIYLFNVHRLDLIQRTFYPLKYHTRCIIIPTSWEVHLKCQRVEEGDHVSYSFTVKLKRIDSSLSRVKASFYVKFYDEHTSPMIYPLTYSKERIAPGDEVEHSLKDIRPDVLGAMASVDVIVTVRNCHTSSDWQRCAPYDDCEDIRRSAVHKS